MSLMMLSSTEDKVTMGSVRLRWMALCGFYGYLKKQTKNSIKDCRKSLSVQNVLEQAAYIEVVTVHSAAYTSLLLWWELLLGELEH